MVWHDNICFANWSHVDTYSQPLIVHMLYEVDKDDRDILGCNIVQQDGIPYQWYIS